jgi:hypothetical protein
MIHINTKRIKFVVFSLIPLIVLAVAANFLAKLAIHRGIETVTDPLTGITRYSMHLGGFPWSHYSETKLNSLGLPDEEFVNILPKNGCIHVVFSGDSFTFGDAVDRDRNWVSIVRDMVALHYPQRCIRIFNIGERMTTIDRQSARIRQVFPLIEPDLVILGQYQNDLTDLTNPGSPAYRPDTVGQKTTYWGDVVKRSVPFYTAAFPRWLTYRAFAFMIQHNMQYDVLWKWSVLEAKGDTTMAAWLKGMYHDLYAELLADLRAHGTQFGVIILPSKMDVLAKRYPEGNYFRALAEEFDVAHLELLPALDSARADYPYQYYDGHLSVSGNRVVALHVLPWLERTFPALFVPQPARSQRRPAGS